MTSGSAFVQNRSFVSLVDIHVNSCSFSFFRHHKTSPWLGAVSTATSHRKTGAIDLEVKAHRLRPALIYPPTTPKGRLLAVAAHIAYYQKSGQAA